MLSIAILYTKNCLYIWHEEMHKTRNHNLVLLHTTLHTITRNYEKRIPTLDFPSGVFFASWACRQYTGTVVVTFAIEGVLKFLQYCKHRYTRYWYFGLTYNAYGFLFKLSLQATHWNCYCNLRYWRCLKNFTIL